MVAALTATDYVAVIGAISAATIAILGALTKLIIELRQTKAIATEGAEDAKKAAVAVYTSNSQSIGELGEQRESRRISHLPEGARTEAENLHLAEIPLPARPVVPDLDRRAKDPE